MQLMLSDESGVDFLDSNHGSGVWYALMQMRATTSCDPLIWILELVRTTRTYPRRAQWCGAAMCGRGIKRLYSSHALSGNVVFTEGTVRTHDRRIAKRIPNLYLFIRFRCK
jgi:hypothetical protein